MGSEMCIRDRYQYNKQTYESKRYSIPCEPARCTRHLAPLFRAPPVEARPRARPRRSVLVRACSSLFSAPLLRCVSVAQGTSTRPASRSSAATSICRTSSRSTSRPRRAWGSNRLARTARDTLDNWGAARASAVNARPGPDASSSSVTRPGDILGQLPLTQAERRSGKRPAARTCTWPCGGCEPCQWRTGAEPLPLSCAPVPLGEQWRSQGDLR